MSSIIFALWFFLPAGVSNATPVFANKIPFLNRWKTPMDFGVSYGDKRLLGDNKTWRGLMFGGLMGGITNVLIYAIYPHSATYLSLSLFNPLTDMFIVGFVLGFGALIGDAVESFFKRRANIPAGHSWFPFDQIDYVIGALIFVTPFVILSFNMYLVILVTWFCLHLITAYIGYLLKLKDKPI